MKIHKKWILLGAATALALTAALVICAMVFAPAPVHSCVTIEVCSQSIPLDSFIKEGKAVTVVTDTSGINLQETGEHMLEFLYKGKHYTGTLKIVDSTPPKGTPVAHTIYNDETLTPEDFVTNIQDATETVASFRETPDFTKVGEQTVTVLLTDSFQNVGTVEAKLTVIADTTLPEFSPMEDLTVNIGQTVSYRKNITVTDDRDGELTFTVDASKVNLEEAGTYCIVYEAVDSSGNIARVERTIIVSAELVVNQELVEEAAKEILAKIITDDMTDHDKITAIYNYTRKNIDYGSASDKDILSAAYRAMTKRKGDCYNYFAMAKVLLDQCGIDNLPVERYKGRSAHYWLLVNIGTGWYHYDPSPQSAEDPFRCFMKTNEQVQRYARNRSDGRRDYYQIDESLYPPLATEKYEAPQ